MGWQLLALVEAETYSTGHSTREYTHEFKLVGPDGQDLFRIGSRSIFVSFPLVSRYFFASPSLLLRFLLATEAESNEEVTDLEQTKKHVIATH